MHVLVQPHPLTGPVPVHHGMKLIVTVLLLFGVGLGAVLSSGSTPTNYVQPQADTLKKEYFVDGKLMQLREASSILLFVGSMCFTAHQILLLLRAYSHNHPNLLTSPGTRM